MDVTVLTPDLSHNCLGRAYLLGELLDREFETEIVGPCFGAGIWSPLEDEFDYRVLQGSRRTTSVPALARQITEQASGDVLYASKPQLTSYGVALLSRLAEHRPLILDVDDWETGFYHRQSRLRTYLLQLPRAINSNSFYWVRLMERLSDRADEITVSNTYLQDHFGGTIVPHVRDTDAFDPARFEKATTRRELGLPADETLVIFFGTPRPHKGVEDLMAAVEACSDDVIGVIVGAEDSAYVRNLRRQAGDRIRFFGQQPFDSIPRWLAAADIAAIPQRESTSSVGQLPAKVFDAMAMGLPIVATRAGDLPSVLGDCGEVVPPSRPQSLATAIQTLANDETRRQRLGRCARERCVERYSYDAAAPRLESIVNSVL